MPKASINDKSTVVGILCESFNTNNSVNYIVRQDRKREKRIRLLMEYSFDMSLMFGDVYLSEDKSACALTLWLDQKRTTLKTIMLEAELAFKCIGITRVFKVFERNYKIKISYPEKTILYLWFIGVKTDQQNKGTGGSLLTEIIRDSELAQKPIYLETSMPENVSFYKKFGFEIYKELYFNHKLYLIKRDLQSKE